MLVEIPHVMKTTFDPLKDVKPVAAVARSGLVLIAAPNVPATDLRSLIAYAKGQSGKASFATYSAGTASHYSGMMLNQKAGLDLTHVPFAGSPPALQQVMAGQIPVMFDGIVTSLPQIKAGKVKPIAMATKTRSAHLPEVPTMAKLGHPEFDFASWLGVIVATGVPQPTVAKMSAALLKAAGAAKVRERLAAAGFDLETQDTPQLERSIIAEHERNAAIVKAFNIKLN